MDFLLTIVLRTSDMVSCVQHYGWRVLERDSLSACPLLIPGILFILGRKSCAKILRGLSSIEQDETCVLETSLTKSVLLRSPLFGLDSSGFAYDLISYFTLNRDSRPVEGMLETWHSSFDIPFGIAVAHWCVCFVEDFGVAICSPRTSRTPRCRTVHRSN